MMDFQLTLPHILRRVETYYPNKEIVTRLPDKSFHRYGYGELARRAKQLAVALHGLGLERGDRVATLCWNHYQHHEAYFGVPCGGFDLLVPLDPERRDRALVPGLRELVRAGSRLDEGHAGWSERGAGPT